MTTAKSADIAKPDLIHLWSGRLGTAGRPSIDMWIEQDGVDRLTILRTLSSILNWDYLLLDAYRDWVPRLDLTSFAEAKRRGVIAVTDTSGLLLALCVNPFADDHLAWSDERIGCWHTRRLVDGDDFAAYLALLEDRMQASDTLSVVDIATLDDADEGLTLASIAEDSSPIVRLVNSTIYDAWHAGVSDIHLECTPQGLRIRYRLDGVLTDVSRINGQSDAEQVISRIKVMAELDIAERRIPQDGRFKIQVRGRPIDFRVSIMPSIFGEDAVLRLLDKQHIAEQVEGLTLTGLGFDHSAKARIEHLAREPYGMLLVTGPTGSGKTTTLYAVAQALDSVRDKIITIEDPVEYQLANALQIPVNERKGLTFAVGLRSILRHDPDTILVGEIRDEETAQIAVQASLTGHLVLTSVHANNAFDVIGRLLHMGIDPYNLVSALNGIVAQRLIRLNCPNCSASYTPSDEQLKASGLERNDVVGYTFKKGSGCGECRGTGYKGRRAIAEVLILNDELREGILARRPMSQLRASSQSSGMQSLRGSALHKVSLGETTLEEIDRVTYVAAHEL